MSVPRPGPSSTTRMNFGHVVVAFLTVPIHLYNSQVPSNYCAFRLISLAGLCDSDVRTSPNTWLISGLVMKSPRVPKTGLLSFM